MTQSAETLRYYKLDSLPVLGEFAGFARDPLAWVLDRPRLGELVETHFLGDKILLCTHPALAEQVLLKQHAVFTKDWFLRDMKRFLGEGLLTAEGDFWKRQRRLAQPAFHRERIARYADVMVSAASKLADRWVRGEARNVHSDYLAITLDVVVRTLFGADLGDEAVTIEHALEAIMGWYSQPVVVAMPALHKPWFRPFREVVAQEKRLDAVIRGLIARRRRDPDAGYGDDLLAMLFAAQDEDGSRMTDTQLRDEVLTVFLAGHETTALTLSWTTWLLAEHPAIQHQLGDEIDAVLGGRAPTLDDLPRLKFAEAVIKESMRVRPPAWALGRESTAPFELLGRTWGPNTQVWVNLIGIHHDARYYEHPERFSPQRWLDGLEKRLPRYAYMPFGGGPRICIGNAFAQIEAVLMLVALCQRWRFVHIAGETVEPVTTITLRPRRGVRVRLEPRRSLGHRSAAGAAQEPEAVS
ncbi:MAG: cytochrome P450 [Myxococcales bacterium]|nr:cytochrome P450 [Myxococcales bacterium]